MADQSGRRVGSADSDINHFYALTPEIDLRGILSTLMDDLANSTDPVEDKYIFERVKSCKEALRRLGESEGQMIGELPAEPIPFKMSEKRLITLEMANAGGLILSQLKDDLAEGKVSFREAAVKVYCAMCST